MGFELCYAESVRKDIEKIDKPGRERIFIDCGFYRRARANK